MAFGPCRHRAGVVGQSPRGCFLGSLRSASWELLGAFLGAFWKPCRGLLGLPGGFLGGCFGCLGALLGGLLEASWDVVGASWSPLRASWSDL